MLGVIDTSAATELAEKHPGWCIALFVSQIFLACIFSLFIKEDLRRLKFTKNKNEKSRAKSENNRNSQTYKLNVTENEPSTLEGSLPGYGGEDSRDISKLDVTGDSQIMVTE